MTVPAATRCRALVAGFGVPGQRDLDFGRQVVRYLEPFRWPDGVLVEDLSYAAPLALHRLQELQPPKLVLVAAVPRGEAAPGAVRRRAIDLRPPLPEDVHQGLVESVSGSTDLDHTLAVLRHWGGLPADSVLIEVEPADCSFGPGFSEELASTFDAIVTLLREELGEGPDGELADTILLDAAGEAPAPSSPAVAASPPAADAGETGPIDALVDYARRRQQGRLSDRHRGDPLERLPVHPSLELAGRILPWGPGLDGGGDWYDVIPLDGGRVGAVVGDAAGRGAEAVGLKSDLRIAVQALALLAGDSPARMISSVDRLLARTGSDRTAALAYLTLDPATGGVRLSTAGGCPPLVVAPGGGHVRFLHDGSTDPAGTAGAPRAEIVARLEPGAVLLLFTDGLVEGPRRSRADGLAALAEAASGAPQPLEALCDHVLRALVNRHRREDDLCLLALRLGRAGEAP